jgi:hypothetical protein
VLPAPRAGETFGDIRPLRRVTVQVVVDTNVRVGAR